MASSLPSKLSFPFRAKLAETRDPTQKSAVLPQNETADSDIHFTRIRGRARFPHKKPHALTLRLQNVSQIDGYKDQSEPFSGVSRDIR